MRLLKRETNTLSLGILGVGNIGSVHLRAANAMTDVEVVAVADAALHNRRKAERAGVSRTYDDYVDLLESESLDAVVIALPPMLHADALTRAADAGVDVFVEKPFARSVEEADAMLDDARSAGIRVGVDHTLRYQPDIRRVKESFDDGAIGHVPYASMIRINDGALGRPPVESAPTPWLLDPEAAGGGVLLELGVHCFDVLEWLFGRIEISDAWFDSTLDLPIEDAATVLTRAPETETTITLHCGSYQWEELPDVNTSLRLEGITGTLDNETFTPDNFYTTAARTALSNLRSRVTGEEPTIYGPTYYLQAHYEALAAFLDAVRNDTVPPVTGEDGKRSLELVEQARAAVDTSAPSDQAVDTATMPTDVPVSSRGHE